MPENYLTRNSPVAKFQVRIFIFDLLMATESERHDDVPLLNHVLLLYFKALDIKSKDTVEFMRQKRTRTKIFTQKFSMQDRLFFGLT